MPEDVIQIRSQPGIKRDGTRLEGDQYVDGQWVRFQRGLPRKIGGYRSVNKYLSAIPRALHGYTRTGLTYVHAASANKVERFHIDSGLNCSVISDRTPASLTASTDNVWQFDVMQHTSVGNTIIGQVAPNLSCLCNGVGGQLFTGDLYGTSALAPVTAVPANFNCSGGAVVLPPYAMAFGNDGYVAWSVPGQPTDFTGPTSGNAYVTDQKIVRGLPLRGGPGSAPSGLFWSANALIRASFIGGTTAFQFDTIATTTVLSPRSIIEYDGIYYWIGTDRFLSFNGVVRDLPNNSNVNFFFDNLHPERSQTVFAFAVPRFGEIWWCFPTGESEEPNHAIIYNVRENSWYDTELPNGGRSAGLTASIFPFPMLAGVESHQYTASAAAVAAGGTGYAVGNVLTAVGGAHSVETELTVDAVSAGAITGVSISNAGAYDTIPANPVSVTGGAGSSATFNLTYIRPYKLWVHEYGYDEVDGLNISPIQSFFETADISLPVQSQVNKGLYVALVEPDFVQRGPMSISVHGRANARAPEVDSEPVEFPEAPAAPAEQVVPIKTQRRELRFRFESNTLGGDYQMGMILAHVQPGDGTILG